MFVCPACSKQFAIKLGVSKLRKTQKEENEETPQPDAPYGSLTVIENVFHYKQIIPLHLGENAIGRYQKGNPVNCPIETVDPSVDLTHCHINVSRDKNGKLKYVLRDFSQRPYRVKFTDGTQMAADTVIIATGASAKYLGLDDEKKYAGQGVSACAVCDGFFYRKKVTAVVGGGDTACEDALYLANLCKKVYLVVRKPYLRASEIMQDRVKNHPNIEILFEHNAIGLFGENGVEGMHLVKRKGEADESRYDLPIDGFFLAIGHHPNTDFLGGQIDLDEMGFIVTKGKSQATNIPGVYAAGDVCDPTYRQAIVAAGAGCKAALEAERYLQTL